MISGISRIDEMKKNKTKGLFASIVLGVAVTACASASSSGTVTVVDRPDIQSVNTNYIGYRAPLRPLNFIKLPVGSIQPEGWVKKRLSERQEASRVQKGVFWNSRQTICFVQINKTQKRDKWW